MIYATSQGNPTDLIATGGPFTLTDGQIVNFLLVSPPNLSALFLKTDNLSRI